jgi:hypothetical protein
MEKYGIDADCDHAAAGARARNKAIGTKRAIVPPIRPL